MKPRLLYLILLFSYLFCVQHISFGSNHNKYENLGLDTIRNFFPEQYGSTKFRYMLSLDIKRGIQSDWSVNSYGLRAGIELNGVHSINLGYFWLVSGRSIIPSLDLFHPSDLQAASTSYRGTFTALYYERAIYQHKRLLISIPSYFKIGRIHRFDLNNMNERIITGKLPLISLAAGLQVQYYFLNWFGPKFTIGYRQVVNNNNEVQNFYNGFYAGLSARIILNEMPFDFLHFKRK